MPRVLDVIGPGGRTLRAQAQDGDDRFLPVFWLHGSPGASDLPEPLLEPAARHSVRLVSYARPGYPGSTPCPGRTVADAAADIAAVADALGIGAFGVLGASGGGPPALACGALLPDRVVGVVAAASPAPADAPGLDWFAGMYPGGEAELRAARAGRDALRCLVEASGYDPDMFAPVDQAALRGSWAWIGRSAGAASVTGTEGFLEDDLATVAPWGFAVTDVRTPVLLLQGGADRIVPAAHARWLADYLPHVELRVFLPDGHVSVLTHAEQGLVWLAGRHRRHRHPA